MLDRESTFANPKIVKLLKTQFIPVAIDQAYQRRQKDTEGDFYRKIAAPSPRGDGSSGGTTQGLYVASPDGTYLGFSNHRDPKRIIKLLEQALAKYEPRATDKIEIRKVDKRYNPHPPDGGLIVRVRAKVLGGYAPTENKWQKIFQSSVSRDNLWISRGEHESLAKGVMPKLLQTRLARFHLVDNTRGEPPMWKPDEIRKLEMSIEDGVIRGSVKLETKDGSRGYDAKLYGLIETKDGIVSRFSLVARGNFWGAGRFTKNPPPGKFPLAVTFELADGTDNADKIPPQGSRGWVAGYLPGYGTD